MQPPIRTALELDVARSEVVEIAAKIAEGKFAPTAGHHCNYCAYRGLCPKTEKRIPEVAAALDTVT